ncbi:lysyl-tRNA synthetase [Mollisia scopiformis]|uniref:lysine--tRNA ligase n=1 Tax=Mollisia scopiformis TaxID=149040 RepID=A0A194XWY4_MOLSC|nr:lysyl-tRNA synthetase [Mollisia scopiformis]KUJ24569.1 lysyl-tRNA synthetase [Mollisia scopiformis]
MNPSNGLRFLRPYLQKEVCAVSKSAYLRFFSTSRARCHRGEKISTANAHNGSLRVVGDPRKLRERIDELKKAGALEWPRIKSDNETLRIADFEEKFKHIGINQKLPDELVRINGRLKGFRVAGSKLVFLDLVQDGVSTQVLLEKKSLNPVHDVDPKAFKNFYHLIRRGDIVSAYGVPHRTSSGQLSVVAHELPRILSPSLTLLPSKLDDRETRIRNRHVDLLVNHEVAQTLKLRSHMIQHMRDFLLKDGFLEVQTPLISDKASGAVAKPFTTVATEFSEKQLALRIAPEIWLKRLVIGGMDRVFEIGPAFRNEGLDATHNPEFTTCEFYKSFADLEELIVMTENMLSGMAKLVISLQETSLEALPKLDPNLFVMPFRRISFIPAIEESLGEKLPDLSSADAEERLVALFTKHSLPFPSSPTLPRLLDKLASIFIEPSCTSPTFITHHPACMAPLSKSFLDHQSRQLVSARAELFIQNREIANMYEEENSPFEQREKFVQQLKWKDEENRASSGVDESYLEALEWGLPPTGGWGCGVDRLVMLFSGAKRISDVLAFGSLRNVVNLGRDGADVVGKEKGKESEADEKVDV